MKVQITPVRKIEDAMMVWHEQVNDVDLVIDPRPPYGLKLRPGTVENLYAFNVLGMTKQDRIQEMLSQWYTLLAPGGVLYVIENDFDYMARAFMGGDLKIEEFNKEFLQTTYLNKDMIVDMLAKAGCPEGNQRMWSHEGIKFPVSHYQIIISAEKTK